MKLLKRYACAIGSDYSRAVSSPPPPPLLSSLLCLCISSTFNRKTKRTRGPRSFLSPSAVWMTACVCVLRWDLTASEVHSQLARDTMPIHVRDSNIKTCIPPFLSLSLWRRRRRAVHTHHSSNALWFFLSFLSSSTCPSLSNLHDDAPIFFFIYIYFEHTHTHMNKYVIKTLPVVKRS